MARETAKSSNNKLVIVLPCRKKLEHQLASITHAMHRKEVGWVEAKTAPTLIGRGAALRKVATHGVGGSKTAVQIVLLNDC